MDNQLNDHLVELHHKVAALKVYDTEAGARLNTYSTEFSRILDELLVLDPEKFKETNLSYWEDTSKYTQAAYESGSEEERSDAFYDGVSRLNDNINKCLEYFSDKSGV